MRRGVTWYESASKEGCENELLFWVQIKENSKIVLPNVTSLVYTRDEKVDGKVVFDFLKANVVISKNREEIEKIEIYYNKTTTEIVNLPEGTIEFDL